MATVKQIQTLLKLTYGLVPIVAGLDKFTNILANWGDYLGSYKDKLPMDATTFMHIVGIIEIIAGLLVLIRPAIGAWIVMIWLLCIAIELLTGTHFYDVAVRDVVMAIGAYSLAQLTKISTDNRA